MHEYMVCMCVGVVVYAYLECCYIIYIVYISYVLYLYVYRWVCTQ